MARASVFKAMLLRRGESTHGRDATALGSSTPVGPLQKQLVIEAVGSGLPMGGRHPLAAGIKTSRRLMAAIDQPRQPIPLPRQTASQSLGAVLGLRQMLSPLQQQHRPLLQQKRPC